MIKPTASRKRDYFQRLLRQYSDDDSLTDNKVRLCLPQRKREDESMVMMMIGEIRWYGYSRATHSLSQHGPN